MPDSGARAQFRDPATLSKLLQKYQPFQFLLLDAGSYARVLELELQKRWVLIVTISMILHPFTALNQQNQDQG